MKIEYYELFEVIDSFTPMDTPDSYYSIGKFGQKEDAEKAKSDRDIELLKKIREVSSWINTHTRYIVKLQTLHLISYDEWQKTQGAR